MAILRSRITRPQVADSRAMSRDKSSREPGNGGSPWLLSASTTSGDLSTFTNSRFQRSRMAVGTLDEATNAYQLVALYPGNPDSAIVGTLG